MKRKARYFTVTFINDEEYRLRIQHPHGFVNYYMIKLNTDRARRISEILEGGEYKITYVPDMPKMSFIVSME